MMGLIIEKGTKKKWVSYLPSPSRKTKKKKGRKELGRDSAIACLGRVFDVVA